MARHQELIKELRLTQEIMVDHFRVLGHTVADGKVYDIKQGLEYPEIGEPDADKFNEKLTKYSFFKRMRGANMRLKARRICDDFRKDYGKGHLELEEEIRRKTGYEPWDDDLDDDD